MTDRSRTPLAAWRHKQGITLRELADLTGRSTAYLSRLERGERRASLALKLQIARRLGVRIADLFEVEDD